MGSIYGPMLPPGGQSRLLLWGRSLLLFGVEGPYGVEGCPYLGSEGPYGVYLGCSAAPLCCYRVHYGVRLGCSAAPLWCYRVHYGVYLGCSAAPLWGYRVLLGCSAAPLWGYRVYLGSIWGAVLPPCGVIGSIMGSIWGPLWGVQCCPLVVL